MYLNQNPERSCVKNKRCGKCLFFVGGGGVVFFLNMNYISILCVKRISFKNLGKTKLDPVPLTCQKQCIKSPGKDPTVCCFIAKKDNS